MKEQANDLRVRTKAFSLRIIRLFSALPSTTVAQVIGKQLLRSATAVGAHYREAGRARSPAEFVSKLEVALQELDESLYWMELLVEGEIIPVARLESLCQEADELIVILVCSINTSKRNNR